MLARSALRAQIGKSRANHADMQIRTDGEYVYHESVGLGGLRERVHRIIDELDEVLAAGVSRFAAICEHENDATRQTNMVLDQHASVDTRAFR